jgi:LuxR family transcriptional regulator, activator of conjugal transfer of Ti plasmids
VTPPKSLPAEREGSERPCGRPLARFFERLTETALLVRDEATVKATLVRLAADAGFDFFAYVTLHAQLQTLLSNLDEEWQARYRVRGYAAIDPVIQRARRAIDGFAWTNDRETKVSREVRSFCDEAVGFGIGSGITIPIRVGFGRRVVLTLISHHTDFGPAGLFNAAEASAAVSLLHACMLKIGAARLSDTPFRLKPEELRCLRWSAEGKSMQAIAVIEETSYSNVAFFLRNAKASLGAVSLPQATAIAKEHGII